MSSSSSSSSSSRIYIYINLCCSRTLNFIYSRNCDVILRCFKFVKSYSRRNIDGLFLFEGKINCHSIVDIISLRVPTKLIRDFSIFPIRNSPSPRSDGAANSKQTCFMIFILRIRFLWRTYFLFIILNCYFSSVYLIRFAFLKHFSALLLLLFIWCLSL
jgi:hypothetical protein